MQKDTLEMIRVLSDANGVSGFEDEVAGCIRGFAGGLGEIEEDHMRNLCLRRAENSGKAPVVMLDAHTDEVGFIVQSIKDSGSLGFITAGGWVSSNIPAHKVRVRGASGQYVPGVVSSKPPHFTSEAERKAAPVVENMAIDVGAVSAAEAKDLFGLRVGEPVVPDVSFQVVEQNNMMIGKAFDCRLGCAAILDALQTLRGESLPTDIVASFAVQEELGLRGARVQANKIKPDLAVVFEAAPADDTFPAPGGTQSALAKGPIIRHIDSTMLANPRLVHFTLDLAEELGIPVQQTVRTTGGTNAGAIHLSGMGVPVVVISLPVRYLHTHYGVAAMADYEAGVKLTIELLRRLTPGVIDSL